MKRSIVSVKMFWTCLGGPISRADSRTVARVGESGEALELTHEIERRTVTERLPLYRAGVV